MASDFIATKYVVHEKHEFNARVILSILQDTLLTFTIMSTNCNDVDIPVFLRFVYSTLKQIAAFKFTTFRETKVSSTEAKEKQYKR